MLPRLKENDVVFIGNALYIRFNENLSDGEKYSTRSGASLSIDDAAKIFSQRLQELAEKIVSKGAKVVVYIDDVQFTELEDSGGSGDICSTEWFRPEREVAKECFQDIGEHLRIINRNFSWRDDWVNGKTKIVWNAYENGNSCSGSTCNASRYTDGNHFKRDYAAYHFYAFVRKHPDLFATVRK